MLIYLHLYSVLRIVKKNFSKLKNICEAFSDDIKKTKFYLIQYDPIKKELILNKEI